MRKKAKVPVSDPDYITITMHVVRARALIYAAEQSEDAIIEGYQTEGTRFSGPHPQSVADAILALAQACDESDRAIRPVAAGRKAK